MKKFILWHLFWRWRKNVTLNYEQVIICHELRLPFEQYVRQLLREKRP